MNFYAQSITQTIKEVHVDTEIGLSEKDVSQKIKTHGSNVLPFKKERTSRIKIFLDQWKSPLILILVVAGTVSGFLGEQVDMWIIYVTALLNACIGYFQEFKANKALEQLRSMVTYQALVLRNGKKVKVKSEDIVPGDIVFVSAGDKIQADGRLMHVAGLEVNEAALTGESEPIQKHTDVLSDGIPLGDRKNMLYRGTTVVNGEGKMVVTATGAKTELGHIATLVKDTSDDKTPLQVQLGRLGKYLSIIVLFLAVGIFAIGLILAPQRYEMLELFQTAVAIAVAAVPEGLVISLTVILAIGMQAILKRKALVRKLVAAETLGSVSVICTDKTGTLTEGNMQVSKIVTFSNEIDLKDGETIQDTHAQEVLEIGILANDGNLIKNDDGEVTYSGDTTDTAMLQAGNNLDIDVQALRDAHPRLGEIPFTSEKKYIAIFTERKNGNYALVKGAPEVLLNISRCYIKDGKTVRTNLDIRQQLKEKAAEYSSKGYRVIAVAKRKITKKKEGLEPADIGGLTFVGFLVMSDPIREEVKETMQHTKKAGIEVVMITGDHARTAQAIAKQLGIPSEDNNIMEGRELEKIDDDKLQEIVAEKYVFARVDPRHKIRIVRAFQARGEVVSMTGDGVNDAPALKAADIGVAVGSGTDVAKETSDIVLLDDSFTTIVAAVEQGRAIYQNIKKVILYLLSGSFTVVILIGGSILGGLPLAVLPAQILWMNIVQETLPTLALAFDKGDKENMLRPPRKNDAALFDTEMKAIIVIMTIVSNIVLFSLFVYYYRTTGDIELTRTLMFVGIGIDVFFYVYAVRSMRKRIWQINPFNNKYLNGAMLTGIVLLLSAIYFPPLQHVLETVPLDLHHWMVMLAFGIFSIVIIEIVKGWFIGEEKVGSRK